MIKKSTSKSAFVYLRVSIGLLLVLASVFLTLVGVAQFPAQAQQQPKPGPAGISAFVPPAFDCAQFHALGLNMQENLKAGAIAIYCGEAQGGAMDAEEAPASFAQQI